MKSDAIGLSFNWERCPDGVELAVADSSDPSVQIFRFRSERRRQGRLTVTNLENPLVVRFLNAHDDNHKLAFFGEYGLPIGTGTTPESVRLIQKRLRLLLDAAGSGDAIRARGVLDRSLVAARLKPTVEIAEPETHRLALMVQPDGLFGLMQMEAAMVAINGARLATCRHCKDVFLTGPLTGRRSHAQYCSDRCRVAAMRLRNASEERKSDVSP